jgi:protein-disulfide isomerase
MIQKQDTNFEQPNPVLDKWKGDKRARFVWVQYSDFQCPFCRKIQPDLEKIYQENSDLAMVYRHYPITSIHPNALNLAIISECSYQIGGDEQFWKLADSFFAYQKQIKTPEQGEKIAILNGVDSKNLGDCLKDQSVVDKVVGDTNQANQILGGMGHGTPTSVIFDRETNRQRVVVGALPLEQLQFELDCLKQTN